MYGYEIAEQTGVEERERLILEHLPQVRLIARRIHERLPESVSLDDLVSAGVLGLIGAIDNFDAGFGVKLKTYAEHKIRGAILDSLRGLDWAPRQTRRQSKRVEAVIAALEQRLQRTPSEEEIAAEMGLALEQYQAMLADFQGLDLGSLQYAGPDEESGDLLRYVADDEEHSPAQEIERAQLEALLARSIERIPRTERTVLSLYYLEELTLREIGEIMGLHPSRVCQLKTQAILRLRNCLERLWPERGGAWMGNDQNTGKVATGPVGPRVG